MDRWVGLLGMAAALLLSPAIFAPAFAQNVGDPCTGTDRQYTVSGPSSSALICNGSTLELLGKDLSNPVRKGVGTAAPAATLDVAGEAKIGNTNLACSATTEGAMRYNSSSKEMEYCNGTAWASISPAAGGGSPTYLGLTSTSYTGGLGGWIGANAKCVSEFGTGARMMSSADITPLSRTSNFPGDGWIDCRRDVIGVYKSSTSVTYWFCLGGNAASDSSYAHLPESYTSCSFFTTSSSARQGAVVTTAGNGDLVSCNSSYPIHCVKD